MELNIAMLLSAAISLDRQSPPFLMTWECEVQAVTLLYILMASSFAAELFRLVDWIEK